MTLLKAVLNMSTNLKILAVAMGQEKVSFHFNRKEGQWKECSNYCTVVLISHASFCLIFFKLGFSSTWTENFQMYKLGFEEAEQPETKLPTLVGSWRKQSNSRKKSIVASLTLLSLWLCGWQQTVENCSRDRTTRSPCLSLEKPVCKLRSNS